MKKIFRNLKFGLLLCTGALAASCSDVEDAMDEIPYTRVLTPLNFEADVDAAVGTDIKFSWSAVSNAEAYVLELFEAVPTITTDEKGNEVETYELPDNFDSGNAFKTIDVEKDAVPYTVQDLEVDKTFWARVRGASARIEWSNWAYLSEPVSTSAVRKALNPQAKERTATSITLKWDDADDKEDLTSIRCELVVPVEGVPAKTVALSKEDIQACEATIDELDPATNYKFTLLFGKSGSRGILTAYTRPDTEGITTVATSEALYNALNGTTGELKLVLAYNEGTAYDLTPYMTLKDGVPEPLDLTCALSIVGESTPEGAKPVLRAAFKTATTAADATSSIHLEDLALDGGKVLGATVTTGGSLTAAEFINCEYYDFTKGIYSGADLCNVETLLFENIYAHDINATGTVGGDFIDIRGGNYGSITIKNSTFYACARTFLRFSDKVMTVDDINVENCTFNQVTATTGASNNSGIFHIRHLSSGALQATITGTFKMTKCVFLNEFNDAETENAPWVRLTRSSTENYAPTCAGNIFYNVGHAFPSMVSDDCHSSFFYNLKALNMDGETMTEKLALAEGGMILADDPCTNSIAGKMYLKNGVIAANKAGDPRWWNASAPVIVRPTELETVTEETTWDFTDKTLFDTETVETNQIIENIRIYAPAQIVMSEGITFSAAATVSTRGVPLSSALGFNAEGYGSVEVTAQGSGITSTVQIIAGGDAYSINADGKPHKIVFGDLIGANDIYVLPSVPGITFTKISWIKDTTPEVVTEVLATPEITWDPAKVNEGESKDAVATWNAITGAASYEISFTGVATFTTTETSYTIPAATVATMAAGDYEISIVAKPTDTSTKYLPSEAGKAKFKVQVVGKPMKTSWIFADAAFDAISTVIGSSDNATVNTTIEGLTIKSSDAAKMKVENRNSARGIRFGKAGSASTTYFSFVVPANAKAGKLTILGRNPSSSVSAINFVASINGTETKAAWAKNDVPVSFDININAGETVYIYPDQGFWFQSIVFDYIDPTQSADVVWDFTEIVKVKTTLINTTDNGEYKLNDDGTVAKTETPTAAETLYFHADGSKKIATNERICSAENKSYFPINYGGGAVYCYLNTNGGGTLSVVAAHAKAPEDNATCVISISVDGTELPETFALAPQDLKKPLCGAKEQSWEIPSTAKKVEVKKKSGSTSPDIYSITWTPAN